MQQFDELSDILFVVSITERIKLFVDIATSSIYKRDDTYIRSYESGSGI